MKIWIDFVCPYCFLAEKPLQEATHGLNVPIDWMPLQQAHQLGIRAVPTIMVGDHRIEGMPDASGLRRLLD